MTLGERFWSKVDRGTSEECWVWKSTLRNGYGAFYLDRRVWYSHRLAYEELIGPIPEGLQLDHLCRNPPCINPAHLEPVTQGENIRRGLAGEVTRARHAATTHCVKGHEYVPENTYIRRNGRRACRECHRTANRQWARDRAARAKAVPA